MTDDDSDDDDSGKWEAEDRPTVSTDSEMDDSNYLESAVRECPDHGSVIPVALPYTVDRESDGPDGYHLVCPRCRHFFQEYTPSNEQWWSR